MTKIEGDRIPSVILREEALGSEEGFELSLILREEECCGNV